MPRPDHSMFDWAQFPWSALQVAVSNTALATKRKIPPGMYLLVCDKAARFLQGDANANLAVAPPAAPTIAPQGASGATTYGYKVVAVMPGGDKDSAGVAGRTAASAEGTTATGNAALSVTNFNRTSWDAVAGAVGYDVYRTTGGATQGKINTTPVTATQFDDTGLAASGAAPATSTVVGTPLRPDVYFGPVYVDADATATFDAKTSVTGETGTLEFVPVRP